MAHCVRFLKSITIFLTLSQDRNYNKFLDYTSTGDPPSSVRCLVALGKGKVVTSNLHCSVRQGKNVAHLLQEHLRTGGYDIRQALRRQPLPEMADVHTGTIYVKVNVGSIQS